MMDCYILKDKTPVRVDILEWEKHYPTINKRVEQTQIGDARVSTVFLGIDHGAWGGPPLIFETMIFGGEHDGYCDRYSTWDEAVAGHHAACRLVVE